MAYDKNTDYQELINKAVKAGDYAAAAKYEQKRNEKIADLNASGTNVYGAERTNLYSDHLDKGAYVPLNSTSASGVNYGKYQNEVQKQKDYIAANPSAAQGMSSQEKYDKYGDIMDSTARSGYYTKDYAAAQAAAKQYGVAVTPTNYNGEDGWYLVGRAKRTAAEGTSGADEGLLSADDYAIVQSLKQQYADAQTGYNAATAAGDPLLAAHYRAAMDSAHLEAERIRAGYGYSGGADGSMHITQSELGVGGQKESHHGGADGSYGHGASGGSVSSGSGSSSSGSSLTVPEFTFGTQIEDYSPYLQQMYQTKKQAAMAELKNAYDNSVAELNRAESGLAEGYRAVRNETAGAHEQERRNFAEYAAANGLNNGAAGQAELARGVTVQNNMNTIRTAEANAMADLTLQRAQAETEYNAAIAQAEYTGEYELAAALYEEKVRVQEALIEAEIRQQQYALERYKLQYQAQRDAVADERYESEQALALQQYEQEQAIALQQYQDSLALQQAAQALKEKELADELELAWAEQLLKEKEQADELALSQAAQALKEKEQADELALAQKKQEDASALDWAAQNLALQKYNDAQAKAQQEKLVQAGEACINAGVVPSVEMRGAMGITLSEAKKQILTTSVR